LQNISKKQNIIKTKSRSSIILQSFIGRTIYVYTGRNYKKIVITEEMIGHKLGEFAFTRKLGNIHSNKFNKRKRK
jgi:small subunit ribosomal protein S19